MFVLGILLRVSQHPMFLHCDGLCHLLLDHKPEGTNVTCAEALSKHVLSGRKEELEEKKEGRMGDKITGKPITALTSVAQSLDMPRP